jgi:hypothetical protein
VLAERGTEHGCRKDKAGPRLAYGHAAL